MESDRSLVLDEALRYANLGWRVFPTHAARDGACTCGYKCSSPAKHPFAGTKGLLEATTDVEQIRQWWDRWPFANVAIATGNGLVVLDVDERHDGYESLKQFGEFPATASVVTGGGGQHFYFSGDVRNSAGRLGSGLDIRGDGGYVLAPPSEHISGRRYEWELGAPIDTFAPLPNDIAQALVNSGRPQLAEGEDAPIPSGSRNATLASLAGTMRRRGMSPQAILAALIAENLRCTPPLEEREVERIAKSVSRYAPEPTAQIEIVATTAPEFLALDIPKPRYLVEGIWPEHAIGFIAGPPKSFKSFLALDMAYALSTGGLFLGHYTVAAPRTVLLIDHESSRGALSERVRRAEARHGEARTLYVISNKAFSLEDPVDVDRLRLEISAVRPDLTVLDPLASFLRGDENSAQQMGMVVRMLRGLRDEFGTGFAIVHHVQKTKDGETTRGGERMRGSSAFYAAAEVGLWVKRVDGEQPRSNVRAEMKDGEAVGPFQVLFDTNLGVLNFIDPYAEAVNTFFSPGRRRTPEQIEAHWNQDV